uniref:Bulb-type lectin domain-containing protein n=1 Tax=Fagus sylvatica TaxID=28930 RepID=A0A2N9GZB5_FAGSY
MIAVPCAQAMGSLMYAMTSTRPDICYVVGLVSRYQSNPGKAHWQAVKRIFRDTNDRISTSGYVFLFGGTTVSWLCKKQGCVAKYTMEAEYIACSTAVNNVVWIKHFVDSLKLDMQDRPRNVFCDNKSAISLIKSGANSSKDGVVKWELWQSFDYPAHTLLPGMKLGINHKTGHTWSLTSWRSKVVPDIGAFNFGLDPNQTDPLVILWLEDIYWSSGSWYKGSFNSSSSSLASHYYNFSYISIENETFFNYFYKRRRHNVPTVGIDYLATLFIDVNYLQGCVEQKQPECRNSSYYGNSDFLPGNDGFKFRIILRYPRGYRTSKWNITLMIAASWKEQKRRRSVEAQSRRLDEASVACTFRQEIHNSKLGRIQSTGLVFQATGFGSNSRPRNPVDWMVFQAIGFARIHVWVRNSKGRLETFETLFGSLFDTPTSSPISSIMAEERGAQPEAPRMTMYQLLHPTQSSIPSCIMFPPNAPHMEIKQGLMVILPNFRGLENENPYVHVRAFEKVIGSFYAQNMIETAKLRFFPFSLKDKVKGWLYIVKPRKISNFAQGNDETLFMAWERFKDTYNFCTTHGYDTWRLVSYFYEGLQPRDRQFVQVACRGEFLQKEPEDAMDYLDEIAENSNTWNGPSPLDSTDRNRSSTTTSGGSVFRLREEDNMNAKISLLTKEIEALMLKGSRGTNAVYREDPMEACRIFQEIDRTTSASEKDESGIAKSNDIEKCPFPAPFPQALKLPKNLDVTSEILEHLHQVKKASCEEDRILDRIDLGASVNLLPFSVYLQLGLGELEPTSITLQLADCSVRKPRGVVEDVLVKVENFYYPIDFIILDIEPTLYPSANIPIILGRHFLATANALINCRNGRMKITFGSMTAELNIFNVNPQQLVDEKCEYVNFIEILEKEQVVVAKNPPRSKKKSLLAYLDAPKLKLKQPPRELQCASIESHATSTMEVPSKESVDQEVEKAGEKTKFFEEAQKEEESTSRYKTFKEHC